MQLKITSYSQQIQIFTLIPDKCSRRYCSEYFNVFEYLAGASHEIKKVGGMLAQKLLLKRKNYDH